MKKKGIYDIQFFYCGQVDIIDYAIEKKIKVVEPLSANINVVGRRHTEKNLSRLASFYKEFRLI